MAINYDEINENLLRVIQNADNQGEFLQNFLGAPAGDVTFKNVAPDGSFIERTVPNLAKFTASVESAVVSVVQRAVFVDPVNGDDGYAGTEAFPLRTFQKAILSVPKNGAVHIYLKADTEHTEYTDIANRVVVVRPWIGNETAKLTITTDPIGRPSIVTSTGGIVILQCDRRFENRYDDLPRSVTFFSRNGAFEMSLNWAKTTNSGVKTSGVTSIAKNTRATGISQSCFRQDYTDMQTEDNTAMLLNIGYAASLVLNISTVTINGAQITEDDYRTLVAGIIRDANTGLPINVVSNILL